MTEKLLDILTTDCCRDFAAAWDRWRGDKFAPRRRDLAIGDIARHLAWLSILDVRSPEEMIFRLVGTAINATRGREFTNMSLRDLSRDQDWPKRSQLNWALVGQPCGLYFRVLFEYTIGPAVWTEYLVLPVLADDDGAPRQIFTIRQPLEDVRLQLPQLQTDYNEIGIDNRYIDVGAGVPDGSTLPEDLPPINF